MFCNACGTEIQPQFNVCPNCGYTTASLGTATLRSRLGQHLHRLAVLWIIAAVLVVITAIVVMMISTIARAAIPATETVARSVGPAVLSSISALLLIVATGGLFLGWGLLKHRSWARMAGIVLGILSLLNPPFGTALGIYTLWVLLSDQGAAEYARLARAT